MAILALCILCNVLLVIIFKYFDHYGVDNLNAIIINYFICVIGASLSIGEFIIPSDFLSKAWFPYAILMAGFFIVGFNIMALSYQKSGVALTVIISKMSLILPVIFAVSFYGESLGILKVIGILVAIAAIVLVNLPEKGIEKISTQILLLPILVLILSGFIEINLFYVQVEKLVTDDSLQFVVTSFGLAGVFGLVLSLYRMFKMKIIPNMKDVLGGITLGLPNFLTIFLLLYLLKEGWEGSVLFPLNNIGILLLTTFVGWILYKEKINLLKGIGLLLAIVAVVFIGMNV